MPRRNRCVVSGVPYHVTQRGVDRRVTFSDAEDHRAYVGLLRQHLDPSQTRLLGWCLISNHLHLVILALRAPGLATLLGRIHGRYAQYYNGRWARSGHLWQSRFYSCALGPEHLWRALAYVERNPVRAGMVGRAEDYVWSSARAHIGGADSHGVVDMEWWERCGPLDWQAILGAGSREDEIEELRRCTYACRPFGDEAFVDQMREQSGRQWRPGRPKKKSPAHEPTKPDQRQLKLFD